MFVIMRLCQPLRACWEDDLRRVNKVGEQGAYLQQQQRFPHALPHGLLPCCMVGVMDGGLMCYSHAQSVHSYCKEGELTPRPERERHTHTHTCIAPQRSVQDGQVLLVCPLQEDALGVVRRQRLGPAVSVCLCLCTHVYM